MNSGELDRQQIRHAIRNMRDEYIFYLLDDAVSLLSQAQLRQLIAPYADPEQFAGDATNENLLSEVLAFQKASLAGEYYKEALVATWNREKNSRGARCWIADFRRLLDRCAAESTTTNIVDVCQAFDILFGLLDCLDDGTGEGILNAEEGGSWMVGIDWKGVLPVWCRVLDRLFEKGVLILGVGKKQKEVTITRAQHYSDATNPGGRG
jgi:hypothetical protein